jgi:hypothetical protein
MDIVSFLRHDGKPQDVDSQAARRTSPSPGSATATSLAVNRHLFGNLSVLAVRC